MLVKFKFRDTTRLSPNVMNNYMNYIASQVKDRHAGINAFEKFDSDFDDISQEERFIDSVFGDNEDDEQSLEIPEEMVTFSNGVSSNDENINIDKGLFSFSENDDIDALKESLRNHKGTVWMPIISMKESDAIKVGMDKESIWIEKTRKIIPLIAEQIGINESNLNWIAGFHEKPSDKGRGAGKQPHIHLLIWEKNPRVQNRMIPKENLETMKQDISSIMETNNIHRDIDKKMGNSEILIDKRLHKNIDYDILYKEPGEGSAIAHSGFAGLETKPKSTDGGDLESEYGADGIVAGKSGRRIGSGEKTDRTAQTGQTGYHGRQTPASNDLVNSNGKTEDVSEVFVGEGRVIKDVDTGTRSTGKLTGSSLFSEESRSSGSLESANDVIHDDFILKLGEKELRKTCADISSFRSLASKDDMDAISDGLIRIRARLNHGESLSLKEKGLLEHADISPDSNVDAVTKRITQCISVDEAIQKLGTRISEDLYSKLDAFGRLNGKEKSEFKRQLEINLYRGLKEIGSPGASMDNVDVIDVIRYGNASRDATRKELVNSLEDLSSMAISRGSDGDSVFRALREFNRKNSCGMNFDTISDIVEEAKRRSASGLEMNVEDSRVQADLNNLGYQNSQIGVSEINPREFYSMLTSVVTQSMHEAGLSTEAASETLEVSNYDSYISHCSRLMEASVLQTDAEVEESVL